MSVGDGSRSAGTTMPPDPGAMRWNGWSEHPGDGGKGGRGLDPSMLRRLEQVLGTLPETPSARLDDVRISPSRLSGRHLAELSAVVGKDHVRTGHRSRVERAAGRSYTDLIRLRAGALDAPDAVVLPGNDAEVAAVLAVCADEGIAVVPVGGGTSVVGGVEPDGGDHQAVIVLDLRRFDRLVELDPVSHVARFGAGIRGLAAERALRERGFTLGHFPQSYEHATLGGYVVTRSAGQASTGYGRFDDLVVGARVVTPAGLLDMGHGGRSAAGPDLRSLVLGSEGLFGVVTQVSVGVRPAPAREHYEGWAAPSFASGAASVRAVVQAGVAPDVVRLSDEPETQMALEGSVEVVGRYLAVRGMERPALLVLGWEGDGREILRRRAAAARVLRGRRLVWLGPAAGSAWSRHRFDGAYQRDDLLDHGVAVDTLETAGSWSQLGELYLGVRAAVEQALTDRGTPGLVMCHISHVYRTGASLYLTWLARREIGDELAQWQAVKDAAGAAIVAAGGTITHHHAVGRDHRRWMSDEVGEVGLDALRAVKERLDPAGILNPGKLLP